MEISRKFRFDASHIVPGKGTCSRLHGHSFELDVTVVGDPDADTGNTFEDVNYLKHVVMPIVQRLNFTHLNYIISVPTVENICLYIAHNLRSLTNERLVSCRVTVPSLFTSEWKLSLEDDQLFDDDKHDGHGFHDIFPNIPAFASIEARAKWVARQKRFLHEHYGNMTLVGARLAAFERYQASLDADEAERLLEALQHAEKENDPTE